MVCNPPPWLDPMDPRDPSSVWIAKGFSIFFASLNISWKPLDRYSWWWWWWCWCCCYCCEWTFFRIHVQQIHQAPMAWMLTLVECLARVEHRHGTWCLLIPGCTNSLVLSWQRGGQTEGTPWLVGGLNTDQYAPQLESSSEAAWAWKVDQKPPIKWTFHFYRSPISPPAIMGMFCFSPKIIGELHITTCWRVVWKDLLGFLQQNTAEYSVWRSFDSRFLDLGHIEHTNTACHVCT